MCKLAKPEGDAEQGEEGVEWQMVDIIDKGLTSLREKVWVIAGLALMPFLVTLATSPAPCDMAMKIKYEYEAEAGVVPGQESWEGLVLRGLRCKKKGPEVNMSGLLEAISMYINYN